MTRKNLLFLTDNYHPKAFDATRTALIKELSKFFNITVIHTNSFNSLDNASLTKEVTKTLATFAPDIILSINASGIVDEIVNYAQKNSIALFSWFWDHPDLLSFGATKKFIENADQGMIFNACTNFSENALITQQCSFLPFSSIKVNVKSIEKQEFQTRKDLHFLGSLWHSASFMQAAFLGLQSRHDNKIYQGEQLIEQILASQHEHFEYQASNNAILYKPYLMGALSSIKRVKILSYFENFDLGIFGNNDWIPGLWQLNPNLLKRFKYHIVSTHEEMAKLMQQFKISLNIFHVQNANGGPNFRILDSAVHGLPILSEYNSKCAEMYKEGETALYFKNAKEAVEKAEYLLENEDIMRKLTVNAANLVNDSHLHSHRIRELAKHANLQITENEVDLDCIEVISTSVSKQAFYNTDETSDAHGQPASTFFMYDLYNNSQNGNAEKATFSIKPILRRIKNHKFVLPFYKRFVIIRSKLFL